VGGGGRLNLFFEAFFDQTNPKSSYEMTGPIWIPENILTKLLTVS